MTQKSNPETDKQWVSLAGIEKPFDQTNGSVDFDPGPETPSHFALLGLVERGVVINTIGMS